MLAASGRPIWRATYIDAALRQQGQAQTAQHQSETLAAAERRHQEDIALRRQQIEEGRSQTGVIPSETGIGPPTIYRTGPGKTYDILTPAGAAARTGTRSHAGTAIGSTGGAWPRTCAKLCRSVRRRNRGALSGGCAGRWRAGRAGRLPHRECKRHRPRRLRPGRKLPRHGQQVPPAARETVKAILAHQIELPEKGARAWFNWARSVDPNYDPSQYAVKKKEAMRPERQLSQIRSRN